MFGAATHTRIYYLLLAVLGGCMVCTNALSSITWVLLLANWLLEGRWREKWEMMVDNRLLHAIVAFFFLHLVALLWSSNLAQGFNTVFSLLPFFVVSTIILTTKPPQQTVKQAILAIYVLTVFVVTVIGFVRWLTIPLLPHREIIPFISHIRFSLNCCIVFFVACTMVFGRQPVFALPTLACRIVGGGIAAWMLFTLFFLRSYTGIVILFLVAPVAALYSRQKKAVAVWAIVIVAIIMLIVVGCFSYYRLSPMSSEPLKATTANGRPYTHKQDGLIENGNYVYNYICLEELSSEWHRRTGTYLYSPTPSGYPVEASLIRYLNALGLTKDSVGVASLSDSQVREIANGIDNPVYVHGSQARKMLYVLLFEYENYRCYRAVNGFSVLQRFELWKTAVGVFLKHPVLGTGTGDMLDEMHRQQIDSNSPLSNRSLTPHNLYLSVLVMFGTVGVLLIIASFLFVPNKGLRHRFPREKSSLPTMTSVLLVVWVVTVLLSCISENTPYSLAGGLFCSWFLFLRK